MFFAVLDLELVVVLMAATPRKRNAGDTTDLSSCCLTFSTRTKSQKREAKQALGKRSFVRVAGQRETPRAIVLGPRRAHSDFSYSPRVSVRAFCPLSKRQPTNANWKRRLELERAAKLARSHSVRAAKSPSPQLNRALAQQKTRIHKTFLKSKRNCCVKFMRRRERAS